LRQGLSDRYAAQQGHAAEHQTCLAHLARDVAHVVEAMLWLRKGFGFAGAWTVREQNRLLGVCFGLQTVNEI